jgi:hypothetical protein
MTETSTTSQALAPKKRPNALYLTFNTDFLNPTRGLLLSSLSIATDLTVYGPGYSSSETLQQGVEKFVDQNGPYDFILTDEYVLQPMDREHPEQNRFVNHACKFDPSLLFQAMEWRDFLSGYSGHKVICLLQSDFYNFPEIYCQDLDRLGDFYISWGPELVFPKDQVLQNAVVPSTMNEHIYERWNDNYLKFAKSHQSKMISCPAFVSQDESYEQPLKNRPYPWACPGADYNARVTARKILEKNGFVGPGRWLPKAFSISSRLHFNVYNKFWTIKAIQWGFRHALRQARYAFTCGSIVRWPIRKFFEIPINGAVLVCETPHGFQNLGFQSGENALTVDAKDILDAHDWLEQDPDRAQSIATAGRQLVLEKHSVEARATQIGAAFTAILESRFQGSLWGNGNFQIIERPVRV